MNSLIIDVCHNYNHAYKKVLLTILYKQINFYHACKSNFTVFTTINGFVLASAATDGSHMVATTCREANLLINNDKLTNK